jgi:hypothetical protein
MRKEQYTTAQLLEVIKSYYILIQRGGRDFPAVVLDDISKSAKSVLKTNGIENIKYNINGGLKSEAL